MKNTNKVLGLFLPLLGTFFISSILNSTYAEELIHEAYIDTTSGAFEAVGTGVGEQMGADIVSGDFNNDGIEDLVASSPFASNGKKKWNGRVTIILGKDNSVKANKSQRSNEWANINIYGKNPGDQLGTSLTVGDFDGDNLDDLAIGAYNALNGSSRSGKTYIIYGKAIATKKTIDFAYGEGDLMVHGENNKDGFGTSVESADLNGDGLDDLLVGAPFAAGDTLKNSGIVYVYFGSTEGISSTPSGMIYGQTEGERFGSDIAAGDIFGDSKAEVVVGAYFSNTGDLEQAGKIYLFAGRDSYSKVKRPTSTISGDMSMGWLGFTVDVADVNGDGKGDVASSYFSYKGDKSGSKVMVFYGDEKFAKYNKNFTSNAKLADVTMGDSVGEAIIGAKVLLEDLNGDGKAEIIAGAPGISATRSVDTGDVYVVYSGEKPLNRRYSVKNKTVTSIIHGQDIDDWFGYSLATGDFNGDGFSDLLVGARYSDTDGGVNNGKVFAVYGNNEPMGEETVVNLPYDEISRAEFVQNIVKSFGLEESNKDYLDNCYSHKEFCFFNFMAISSFDGLALDPQLILYPDVAPTDKFFGAVNVATALGLINGFTNEADSPFKPHLPISRVQALKVILSATGLVQPLHRFELVDILGGEQALSSQNSYFLDVNPKIAYMWWYPRYINFAVDAGIIEKQDHFRPDDNLSKNEFNAIVGRTLDYLNKSKNEKTQS